MNQMYEQKYLKYKAKYLELKNQMKGGVICPTCGKDYNPSVGEKCNCSNVKPVKVTHSAKATFVDVMVRSQINISINNESMVLSVGDCIRFNRVVKEGENPSTIAKILGFGYNGGTYVNRIFFLPWRKEGRWGSHALIQRQIGLEWPYVGGNDGDWTSIIKLEKCPEVTATDANTSSTDKKE